MNAPGLVKKHKSQPAHLLGVLQVHPVPPGSIHDHVLAVSFQLTVRARALVILRGHLRKNSVTQSEWRVTKALEAAGAEHMCVHRCASHDDLRALGIDSLDASAL